LFIFFFTASLFHGFSQGNHVKDSLRNKIRSTETDSIKVMLLNDLSLRFWSNRELDSCLFYARKSLDLVNCIGYLNGKGHALSNFGLVYFSKEKYLEALQYFKRAVEIFKKTDNQLQSANNLNNIGIVYKVQRN